MSSSPKDPQTISLDRLPLGKSGVVTDVDSGAKSDTGFRQRLLELGLVPGVTVRISQIAPFGDPLRVELRGAGFSIRRAEAASIQVRPFKDPITETSPQSAVREGQRRVVMMGNPNVGKSSLFNALTGHNAKVGNYPGITVDRLEGPLPLKKLDVTLVDVPGTYTLNARSRDEQVAIFELLGLAGQAHATPLPDAVIVVLRYQTLQRGLYFLMQVQELGLPVVAVVNMMDEARSHGDRVNLASLSKHFHIPFVGTVAQTGEGLAELKDALSQVLLSDPPPTKKTWHWEPSEHLAGHLDEIAEAIDEQTLASVDDPERSTRRKRAFALWCLMSVRERDCLLDIPCGLRERTLSVRKAMLEEGHDLNLEVTQSRYQHIDEDVDRYGWKDDVEPQRDVSEVIDNVLTHPFWGLLIFLGALTLIFWALFDWATPLVDGISALFDGLRSLVGEQLGQSLFGDFVANGLIAGVGAVLGFLPQILILFSSSRCSRPPATWRERLS
jgi:ferrous iron transport protein B